MKMKRKRESISDASWCSGVHERRKEKHFITGKLD
jgi:hypothetical protein